jgi:hypothetical protein
MSVLFGAYPLDNLRPLSPAPAPLQGNPPGSCLVVSPSALLRAPPRSSRSSALAYFGFSLFAPE